EAGARRSSESPAPRRARGYDDVLNSGRPGIVQPPVGGFFIDLLESVERIGEALQLFRAAIPQLLSEMQRPELYLLLQIESVEFVDEQELLVVLYDHRIALVLLDDVE